MCRELQEINKLTVLLKMLKLKVFAPLQALLTADTLTCCIRNSTGVTNNMYDGSVLSRCPSES